MYLVRWSSLNENNLDTNHDCIFITSLQRIRENLFDENEIILNQEHQSIKILLLLAKLIIINQTHRDIGLFYYSTTLSSSDSLLISYSQFFCVCC
ncbi:unnamed protein product [Rhizophagus irregularis]|nr:unnamed protein product [Rhizophagus irregularis]